MQAPCYKPALYVILADFCLFDILDLHCRIFAAEMESTWPDLVAFCESFEELPGVKEYRASPRCFQKINGNSLG